MSIGPTLWDTFPLKILKSAWVNCVGASPRVTFRPRGNDDITARSASVLLRSEKEQATMRSLSFSATENQIPFFRSEWSLITNVNPKVRMSQSIHKLLSGRTYRGD